MGLQNRIERLEEKLNDPDRPCPVCKDWPRVFEWRRNGVVIEKYHDGRRVEPGALEIPEKCAECGRRPSRSHLDEAWILGEDEEERLARAERLKWAFVEGCRDTHLFAGVKGGIELPGDVSIEVDGEE